MPYADKERQRAYNREWWKRAGRVYSDGPLAREIEATVRSHGPIGPAEIVKVIGRSTPNSVGVALHHLRANGRVERIGYGKWVSV